MKQINRLLALTLCALLAVSPLCTALSEEELPGAEGADIISAVELESASPIANVEPEGAPEEDANAPAPETPEVPPEQSDDGASDVPPAGDDPAPGEPPAGDTTFGEPSMDGDVTPGDAFDGDAVAPDDAIVPGDVTVDDDMPGELPAQDGIVADAPAIDYARGADASPEFAMGYAQLLGECPACEGPDADAQALYLLPRGGVVYATRRSGKGQPDRLEVAFDIKGECAAAWIDAAALRPMSPDEANAFVEFRAAQEGTRFLYDAVELPLDALQVVPLNMNTLAAPYAPAANVPVAPAPDEPVPGAKLIVAQTKFVLGAGENCEIGAGFDDGQEHGISYESDAPEVADVSSDGKIVAIAVGEARITLRSEFNEALEIAVQVRGVPKKVTLRAPRTKLGVGEEIDLAVSFAEGTASKYLRFTSNKKSVAEVSAEGHVKARAAGKATVTVETFNGAKGSVTITVKAAPKSVSLDKKSLVLGTGQTGKLKATLSKNSAGGCTFTAKPEGIVSVDSAGNVTALAEGTAEITASTFNGKSTSCAVKVRPAPTEIAFAVTEVTIGAGETVVSKLLYDGAQAPWSGSYSVKNSAKKFATYNAKTGKIKGVAKGTATITATAYNGVSATLKVTVKKAPASVKLSAPRKTLGVGESVQLTAKPSSGAASRSLKYASSKSSVASVDKNGLVTANAKGTAQITVKTFNGKTATVKITVKAAPSGIKFNQTAPLVLGKGQKSTVSVTLTPSAISGAYTFGVKKGGEDVLAVNATTGAVEALEVGEATIVATPYNVTGSDYPKTIPAAELQVQVLPAPDEVKFAQTEVTIGVGEKYVVPKVILPDGTMASYSIKSAKSSIAKYDSKTKKVTGKKAGSTDIVVTTHNGLKASFHVTVKTAPGKVTLNAPRKTLGMGETLQLKAKLPKNTASNGLTYASSNTKAVEVDKKSGLVTAVGTGKAKITVKTFNKKTAAVTITVKKAPTSITFNQKELVLGVGQETKVSVSLSANSAGAYAFSVDDAEVLAVDASTGAVKALAEGEATVTATPYNVKGSKYANPIPAAKLKVSVVPAPGEVSFAEAEVTVGVGETYKVPAVVLPNGTMASYSIKSAKSSIAKYDSKTGKVKGVKAGTTNLVVTTHNGLKANFKVTVKKAPGKVTLSAGHATLGVNETLQLKVKLPSGSVSKKRTFTSSKSSVASVDKNGLVTANAKGTAKITVKTFNGKTSTVKLTVVAEPTQVSLPASLVMGKGEGYTIPTTMSPKGSGGGRIYSVEDEGVATVDPASGKIQARTVGSTTVRVEFYNGLTAECALTVKNAPAGVALQDKSFTLSAGDTRQLLPPVLSGTDVASATIKYKSDNKSCVKVSSTGKVTAVKAGSAKIKVSTYNKTSKTIKVTVKAAPKSISFKEKSHRLFIDREFKPAVKFANNVSGNYTLASSDPSIAQIVGDDGHSVRGVAGGTVTITATSYNKKKAKMTVDVPFLPDRVSLDPKALTLGEGDSNTVIAVMPAGQGAEMTFAIDDPGIAEVEQVDNETVRIVARGKGATVLHATTQNGKTAKASIRVLKAPTALYLSPSSAGRCIDEKQLALSWSFNDAEEGGSVSFKSSDAKIATVSAKGVVSFVKTGTVKITATTYNGYKATCSLTIGVKPGKMSFAQGSCKVALDDCAQIPVSFDKGCESYTLTSSNPVVAEIVSGEYVRGKQIGRATLNAVSRSGLKASCEVEIVNKPTGLQLGATEKKLVVGRNSTYQMKATPLPDGVGTVRYATSDPKVATVDPATGLVTAAGKGDCTIIATTYNGVSAECKIKVSYLLEGVSVGIDPGHQAVGDMGREPSSPAGGETKYRCAHSSYGVARVQEHEINLTVSLKLRDALEKLGATVYMTRTKANVNISNRERALLLNKKHVDLALRIHCNSADASSANGLSLFYRKTCAYSNKQVDSKQKTAANLMKNENLLGWAIADQYTKATGCNWRGLTQTNNYTMNNWSTVPCLLVELGFMTNPDEGWKLVNASYQKKMVKGLVNGICVYMKRDKPTEW